MLVLLLRMYRIKNHSIQWNLLDEFQHEFKVDNIKNKYNN